MGQGFTVSIMEWGVGKGAYASPHTRNLGVLPSKMFEI